MFGESDHAPAGIPREFMAVSPREAKQTGTVTNLVSRSPLAGLGDVNFLPSPCSSGPVSFFRSPGSVCSLDLATPARLPSLGRLGGCGSGDFHIECSPQHHLVADEDKQKGMELPPLRGGSVKPEHLESALSLGLKVPGAGTSEGTKNFVLQLQKALGRATATPSLALGPANARLRLSDIIEIEIGAANSLPDVTAAPAMRSPSLSLSELIVVDVDPITVCRDDEAHMCDSPTFSTSTSTGRSKRDERASLPAGSLDDPAKDDCDEGKHDGGEEAVNSESDRSKVQSFQEIKKTRLTVHKNLNSALDEALESDLAIVIGDEILKDQPYMIYLKDVKGFIAHMARAYWGNIVETTEEEVEANTLQVLWAFDLEIQDGEEERERRNNSMLSGQKPTKDKRTCAFKKALITAGIAYKGYVYGDQESSTSAKADSQYGETKTRNTANMGRANQWTATRWEVQNRIPSVVKPTPPSMKTLKSTSVHARMMLSLTKNVEEAAKQDTVGTNVVAGRSSCKSKATAAQRDDSCRSTTSGARVYNASFLSGPNLATAAENYPHIAFLQDSSVGQDRPGPRPPLDLEACEALPSVPSPEVLIVPGMRNSNPSNRIESRHWQNSNAHPLARALTGLDATQVNDPSPALHLAKNTISHQAEESSKMLLPATTESGVDRFTLEPISNHQWSQTLGSSSMSRESCAKMTDVTAENNERVTKRRTYTPLKLRDGIATKGCKDSKEDWDGSEGTVLVGNKRRRRGKGEAKLFEGQSDGKKSRPGGAGRNGKRPLDDPNVAASEDASAPKRCKNSASAETSRVSPTTPVLSEASKLDMLSSVAHADLGEGQTSKPHIDGQEASVTVTVGETHEGDTSNLDILSSLAGSLAFQYSVTNHLLAATR